MKFLFAVLCSCLSYVGFAQYTAKLDSRASVVFPSKTQEMQGIASPIIYNTLDREHKITGMATAIDATDFGVDSTMIVANYNNTLFVDLILQNITGQYPGMNMVSKKKIAKGKMMGYEVVLKNETPSEKVPYKNVYAQVFFSGATIYALTVLALEGVDATADRDKFFNSLKVD